MILVTGTKRSGTSMWMQVLRAAGIPVLGEAFPRDWEEVLGAANPGGFFESHLRSGVNFETNPHPRTGVYLRPDETRLTAVKVFVPGVLRSDLAFVHKVLASIRNWREYHGSILRLYAMEAEARHGEGQEPFPHLTPTLEWWRENFALIADFGMRRYPIHMTAYESVVATPEDVIPEALGWLGTGDVEQALAAVRPELRTHDVDALGDVPDIDSATADVLDELYARVRDRRPLDETFVRCLNETNTRLAPRMAEELKRVRARRQEIVRERIADAKSG